MKKLHTVTLRTSDAFKAALIHTANAEDKELSEWIIEILAQALNERGVPLPANCPERSSVEAPIGSLNEELERYFTQLMPEARRKSMEWAKDHAESDFQVIREALEQIDDPALWNDVHQTLSIPGRTARQKLHTLKFRLQAYRQKETGNPIP